MFEECLSAVIVPVNSSPSFRPYLGILFIPGSEDAKSHSHVCTSFPVKTYNMGISLLGKSLTGCSRVFSVVAISEHFSLTQKHASLTSENLKEQFCVNSAVNTSLTCQSKPVWPSKRTLKVVIGCSV